MKTLLRACTGLLLLSLPGQAGAAILTNSFLDLPAELQCNQNWTNQDVVLHFTETVPAEDGGLNPFCHFGVGLGFVELYPCRLALDLSRLPLPVAKIEVDFWDKFGPGGIALSAYSAGLRFAQVTNTGSRNQTLALVFPATRPDACLIRCNQSYVDQIRIYTQPPPPPTLAIRADQGALAVSWPANAGPFTLEKTPSLAPPPGWTPETNNIQAEGANLVHRVPAPLANQFYRLRQN